MCLLRAWTSVLACCPAGLHAPRQCSMEKQPSKAEQKRKSKTSSVSSLHTGSINHSFRNERMREREREWETRPVRKYLWEVSKPPTLEANTPARDEKRYTIRRNASKHKKVNHQGKNQNTLSHCLHFFVGRFGWMLWSLNGIFVSHFVPRRCGCGDLPLVSPFHARHVVQLWQERGNASPLGQLFIVWTLDLWGALPTGRCLLWSCPWRTISRCDFSSRRACVYRSFFPSAPANDADLFLIRPWPGWWFTGEATVPMTHSCSRGHLD